MHHTSVTTDTMTPRAYIHHTSNTPLCQSEHPQRTDTSPTRDVCLLSRSSCAVAMPPAAGIFIIQIFQRVVNTRKWHHPSTHAASAYNPASKVTMMPMASSRAISSSTQAGVAGRGLLRFGGMDADYIHTPLRRGCQMHIILGEFIAV